MIKTVCGPIEIRSVGHASKLKAQALFYNLVWKISSYQEVFKNTTG
jgi:hypothetical protein